MTHDETEAQRLREERNQMRLERDQAILDRDEAYRLILDWEWERCGDGHEAAGHTKRTMADAQGPGTGARLFPEEMSNG